jgi:hypothetical protein
MSTKYLSDAALDIIKATSFNGENKRLALQSALASGCAALTRLFHELADQSSALRFAFEQLEEVRTANLQNLPADLNAMLREFMKLEDALFSSAGVDPKVRDFIREEAMKLGLDPTEPIPKPAELRDRLVSLKNTVCETRGKIASIQEQEKVAKKGLYFLAGALTMGINGSVDAVTTLGLAPWATALSGGVGGVLIGKGLN